MKISDSALNLAGSAFWFALAPGALVGVVPWLITGWERQDAFGGLMVLQILGGALILLSGSVLIESFVRFSVQGDGTPAPIMPTKKLVVKGLYRWVRNPMYVSVIGLILGQAVVIESIDLIVYGAAMGLALHFFVLLFEEPRLRREFPVEYDVYCKNVGRWLPRLTPWRPERKKN